MQGEVILTLKTEADHLFNMHVLIPGYRAAFPWQKHTHTHIENNLKSAFFKSSNSISLFLSKSVERNYIFSAADHCTATVITAHNRAESLQLWKVQYNCREVGKVFH